MVNIKNAPSTSLGNQGSVSLAEFRAKQKNLTYDPYKKVISIEDDPIKRGLVTLDFNALDYTDNEELKILINKIKEYNATYHLIGDLVNEINTLEENPKSFEEFYFSLYSASNGLFKKSQILKTLNKEIQNSINYIDKFMRISLNRLPYLKVKDSDNSIIKNEKLKKKEELKNYLENLKSELESLSNYITENSKGTGIISNDIIQKIIEKVDSIEFISFNDMYLRNVNRLLEKNIYNSIIYNKNTLNFKIFFEKNFKEIQKYTPDKLVVKFRVPSKEVMKNNFLVALEKSDIPDKFKKTINKNIDILEIKDNFILNIEHTFNNSVLEKLNIASEDLSKSLMIIRTLSQNPNITPENIDEYLNIFDKEFITEKKLDKNALIELSKIRVEYNNILESFNKLYSDSISLVDLIEAPEIIDKVYYRNYSEIFANIFQNYVDAWHAAPFSKYYINTVFMATSTTVFEIIIAAMAAFAFAKLEFWGKNFLFTLFLATMMVPGEVMLVPNFITISKFRWLDTYYALIIPWIVSVFAIFLLRQQMIYGMQLK